MIGNTNIIKNNSIESINTLLVPATNDYSFRYELQPDKLQLTSCFSTQLCYDCMYNLEISITDELGDMSPIIIDPAVHLGTPSDQATYLNKQGSWTLNGNTITSNGLLNGTIESFDCTTLIMFTKDVYMPGDKLTLILKKQ